MMRTGHAFRVWVLASLICLIGVGAPQASEARFATAHYFNIYLGDGAYRFYRLRLDSGMVRGDLCWFDHVDVFRVKLDGDSQWWKLVKLEDVRHACAPLLVNPRKTIFATSGAVEFKGGKFSIEFEGDIGKDGLRGDMKIVEIDKDGGRFVWPFQVRSNHSGKP